MPCRRAQWLRVGAAVAAALVWFPAEGRAAGGDSVPVVDTAPPAKQTLPLGVPYTFSHVGHRQGLPHSQVRAIAQDAQGFLWFGMEEGLAKYDGRQFRAYYADPHDPKSLSSSFINALAVGADGRLWVGTSDGGLDVYDPRTDAFTRYRHDAHNKNSLSSDAVNVLRFDAHHRLWLGMADGTLSRLNAKTGTFTHLLVNRTADGDAASINALAIDGSGHIWVGTGGLGVRVVDPGTGKVLKQYGSKQGLSGTVITALRFDHGGKLWIGTRSNGVDVLDPGSDRIRHYGHDQAGPRSLTSDEITTFVEDRAGRMWVGTRNGITRFSADRLHAARFHASATDPEALSFPWVMSAFQDREGVVWFGTQAGGLTKYVARREVFAHPLGRVLHPGAFVRDRRGRLWIGSLHPGSLTMVPRHGHKAVVYYQLGAPGQPPLDLRRQWVTDLLADRRGHIWLTTTSAGLIRFDPRTGRYTQYQSDPSGGSGFQVSMMWSVVEDRRGNLWVATWGGGLSELDPQTGAVRSFFSKKSNKSLSSDYIYTLRFDREDPHILWVGTAAGGLCRFDTRHGTATRFEHDPNNPSSLSHNDVLSIYQDRDHSLWLGTYGGGLDHLDLKTGKSTNYTTKDGLSDNVVYGVVGDGDGNLWLSTNTGLTFFNRKQHRFTIFDEDDGVQSEFSQGAYYRDSHGRIYLGGPNGFNAFDPHQVKLDSYQPPLAFTSFRVIGKKAHLPLPIWFHPTIELGYQDAVFSVEFAALAFAAPSAITYRYRLDGLHTGWINTRRNYVTYSNLDGGHYVLRVQAKTPHGGWGKEQRLDINVASPPWKTWWAYLVYASAVLGLGLWYRRSHRVKLQRVHEQSRLAQVERDLELTAAVQASFLPEREEYSHGRVLLRGFYRPAGLCSGDWWWYERIGPRIHAILVGDVTGHGPGPAMVTAAVATSFRVQRKSKMSIIDRLESLNREVLRVGKGRYQMTMTALFVDEETGDFTLYSAGGQPMLVLEGRNDPCRIMSCGGTPLGTKEFFAGSESGSFGSGGRVLLCTDGIPELEQKDGRRLGLKRLSQMFEQTRGWHVREAVSAIVRESDKVRGEQNQEDDWTFAIVEWGKHPRESVS